MHMLKRDKKEEEDGGGNPFGNLEKSTVLQEARMFNETPINPRKCGHILTKLLYLINQGESVGSKEATEAFFAMTKLFQSKDTTLRRLVYLGIKEMSQIAQDVIIVTSSLMKDMTGKEDQFRGPAIRALCSITDNTMLQSIERYMKQAIVDKVPAVSSAALVSSLHLSKGSHDITKRWVNEAQEAVNSDNIMVQYHALGLLYHIRKNDKLAVNKLVSKFSKHTLKSPYAYCLLIRIASKLIEEEDAGREEWEELPAQKRPPYISGHDWATLSKTSFRPEARYGSGGGIFPGGGRMYVSQGFSNVRYFDTFTYDVNALGWQREHCSSCHPYDPRYPHARCLHASTTISNDELVIFGGCLSGGGSGGPCPSGDSWLFDNRLKTWRKLDNCATPRTYASMAELPSTYGRRRVVLYGGFEEGEQVLITNPSGKDVVAVLSPETGKWSQRKTTAVDEVISTPGRRASTGMVTGRSGIFMFGGVDINMNALLSDLWFLRGNARDADHSEEVACSINFVNLITIHGVLMVIGWGVFLQWGAFVARYMKFKSGLWFYVHVFFQVFGLCCVVAGLVFSILSVQFDHFKFTHAIIGLVATTLAALQPLNALIRPLKIPDNDDTKTQRRRVWECIHHFGGRCALLLAFINISLGVFLGVAQMVIWALWFSYLGFIVFVYGMAELCRSVYGRRRVDTLGDSDPVEKTKYNFVDIPKEPPTDYITGETNGL